MKFPALKFPVMSPRRTLLIARRDFLGYVKTWGFWLTALGPFFGILFGVLMPFLMAKSEPVLYAAILDDTGMHGAAIEKQLEEETEWRLARDLRELAKITVPRAQKQEFETLLKQQGSVPARAYLKQKIPPFFARFIKLPESKLKFVPVPAQSMDALTPYLTGGQQISVDGAKQSLSGVLHLYQEDGVLKADYWSTATTKNALISLTNRYFRSQAQTNYLQSGGLNSVDLSAERSDAVQVSSFNPAKTAEDEGGQKVTSKDRIPYYVAAAFSVILWFTVFTGAYMLLVSMVEEKINKVLEMLLASTRFSEIFFGKLLGVAALTLASLLPWIILGVGGFFMAMQFGDGALAAGLANAISAKMLMFLVIFFVLGYVFYGSMFIALGALAESMQDASTLMTPMVLLLTACIMVVPIGIAYPDSSLLAAAQWFPFSAPFAALIRLPSDPPLWETLGSVAVLVASSVLVVWFSARLFQHGVLSGGGMASVKAWFGRKLKPTK